MFCFPKIQHSFQYGDLPYVPAYGEKIPVLLTFVFGSREAGTKEAAAFAVAKQSLLLLGGQHKKPKSECQWWRCWWPAVSLLGLAPPRALCQGFSSSSPSLLLFPSCARARLIPTAACLPVQSGKALLAIQ